MYNSCCCCCLNGNQDFYSIFVASGTGIDPTNITSLELDVPFGDALYQANNLISHWANAAEFIVNESGRYEISYQIAVYLPALDPSLDIDVNVNLLVNSSRMLDTVHFAKPDQLVQRTVEICLNKGDVLKLQAVQPTLSELSVNSQAIVIQKIG